MVTPSESSTLVNAAMKSTGSGALSLVSVTLNFNTVGTIDHEVENNFTIE